MVNLVTAMNKSTEKLFTPNLTLAEQNIREERVDSRRWFVVNLLAGYRRIPHKNVGEIFCISSEISDNMVRLHYKTINIQYAAF